MGPKRVRTGSEAGQNRGNFFFSVFGFQFSPFRVRLSVVVAFRRSAVGVLLSVFRCRFGCNSVAVHQAGHTHTITHRFFFWKHRFLESVITQYMFDYKGYTLPMLQASMANFQHHICTGCLTGQNGSETGRKWVRNGSEMG